MFKMLTYGLESRVELVYCMTKGDLHHAYMMFNHIKWIYNLTMLRVHIYELFC